MAAMVEDNVKEIGLTACAIFAREAKQTGEDVPATATWNRTSPVTIREGVGRAGEHYLITSVPSRRPMLLLAAGAHGQQFYVFTIPYSHD